MKPFYGKSFEGQTIAADGRLFIISNGRRCWLDMPPPDHLLEMQLEAERLERSRAMANERRRTLRRLRKLAIAHDDYPT